MQTAISNSQLATPNPQLTTAGPDAPRAATCPECGGTVHLRRRKRMDGTITYFYRHQRGEGENCPRRYQPTR